MGKFLDTVDIKALRFAVGFPVLLAAAFALSAAFLRPDLPEPLAVRWNDDGGISFARAFGHEQRPARVADPNSGGRR